MWLRVTFVAALLMSSPMAHAQFTSVTLAWDANQEPDLAGYRLYYATYGAQSAYVEVPVSSQPKVTLDSLTAASTYTFYVTAYNTAGLESDPSETITYTTPDLGSPRLAGLEKVAGVGFTLTASGTSGSVYLLQATSDLKTSPWTTIDSAIASPEGTIILIDPVADIPRRFYRLLKE